MTGTSNDGVEVEVHKLDEVEVEQLKTLYEVEVQKLDEVEVEAEVGLPTSGLRLRFRIEMRLRLRFENSTSYRGLILLIFQVRNFP